MLFLLILVQTFAVYFGLSDFSQNGSYFNENCFLKKTHLRKSTIGNTKNLKTFSSRDVHLMTKSITKKPLKKSY